MTLIVLGLLAGLIAGFFGVGGGSVFVPSLTLAAGLSVIDAEATSLVAIIPVALVGAAAQHRYGNVRWRDAATIGLIAIPGALVGVLVVHNVPEQAVRIGFAGLMVFVAFQLVRAGLRERRALGQGSTPGPTDSLSR